MDFLQIDVHGFFFPQERNSKCPVKKTGSLLVSVEQLYTHITSMGIVITDKITQKNNIHFSLLMSFWAVLFCSDLLLCSFNKSQGLSSLI